jgi:hypothetical protein
MGTKTLYVSEADEQVWEAAKTLGGDAAESLSRLVTDGLRLLLDERSAAATETEEEAVAPEDKSAVALFGRELRRLGWERTGRSYTRACIEYGAARSRAKRKADDTMGPEGRSAAARKAQNTRGVEGRKAAARKAWNTRKGRA